MIIITICTALTCAWEIDTWHEVATQLPACRTEDSTQCVWLADQRGNGRGDSFIAIDTPTGTRWLYEPMDGAMRIEEEVQ